MLILPPLQNWPEKGWFLSSHLTQSFLSEKITLHCCQWANTAFWPSELYKEIVIKEDVQIAQYNALAMCHTKENQN